MTVQRPCRTKAKVHPVAKPAAQKRKKKPQIREQSVMEDLEAAAMRIQIRMRMGIAIFPRFGLAMVR